MPQAVKAPRRPSSSLSAFYARPVFLLRRANQIAFNIAGREGAAIGLTPPQYAFIIVIDRSPPLDQRGLGKTLGIDRVSAGQILRSLESRGLLERVNSGEDGRRKIVSLTGKGKRLAKAAHAASLRVSRKVLSVFTSREAKTFVALLSTLVDALNHQSPTPVQSPEQQRRGGLRSNSRK